MAMYAYSCRDIETCKDVGPNCSYRTTRDLGPTIEEECEGIGIVIFDGGPVSLIPNSVPVMTKLVEIKGSGNSLIVPLQKFEDMNLKLYDQVRIELIPYVDDALLPLGDLGMAMYRTGKITAKCIAGDEIKIASANKMVRSYSGMLGIAVTGLCRKLDLDKGRIVVVTITNRTFYCDKT